MFGLQGAILWGFIAFILNFIPTIGSIIAVLVPTSFCLSAVHRFNTSNSFYWPA